MKNDIKNAISKAIEELYPEHKDIVFSVEYAPANTGADFASNVAMILAKKAGKKPMEVAEDLAKELNAEAAAPGFLNFKFTSHELLKNLKEILKQKEKYGQRAKKSGESVLVEYYQPNIAKPLHVGHMRSAIIGDSLYRISKLFVKKVESDTHMGDWGTQFGMLIAAYKNKIDVDSELAAKMLEDVGAAAAAYAEYSYAAEAQTEDEMREIAKQEFVKLEKGDKENRKIWKQMVDTSMKEFLKINDLMGILPFDNHWPESFFEDRMPSVVEALEKKGLLKESNGAKVVDLEKFELGTAVIIKSDGGTTYLLRDLATYLFRESEKGFARQLYVVDVRQSHHFQQMFKILELLGIETTKESAHVAFGFMKLPGGTLLSTRKGNVVDLTVFVKEAEKRAARVIEKKNPDLKNKADVARTVALGAIKYADLKNNRKSDIVFNWDEAFNFEGNSGPYLQYTYARLKSILRKSGSESHAAVTIREIAEPESLLLRKLLQYQDVLEDVVKDFLPSLLANYLHDLARGLNTFYHEVPVLKAENESEKRLRLALVQAAAQILKNGLSLLGIEAPEEM